MSRGDLVYGERRPLLAGEGVSVEVPVEGLYAMKLRRDGVRVGIRIWHGPPNDPVTGEEMDRSHRWQASANGRYIDFDRVWPVCTKEPIDQAEYDHLVTLQRWAEDHAPDSAFADPRRPIDLIHCPLPF